MSTCPTLCRPTTCRTVLRLLLAPVLAAALGACAGSATVTDTLDAGPLRLQRLQQRSGMQITVNSSSGVDVETVRLSHRGRVVPLPSAGSGRLQMDGTARQGWLLVDAARPAALLATDRWLLVTDQDGRAQVQTLGPAHGQLRWLDAPAGTPSAATAGASAGVPNASAPLALRGGRQLLLDEAVLLDTATLRARRLDVEAPAGYQPSGHGLVAVSPDGTAAVVLHTSAANTDHDMLLQTVPLDGGPATRLPLDWAAYADAAGQRPSPEVLLQQHARWEPGANGAPARLQLRPPVPTTPWQVRYDIGPRARQPDGGLLPRFTLWPVRPSALPAAVALSLAPDFQPVPAQPGAPDASRQVRLRLQALDVDVLLRLDGERLVVDSGGSSNPTWSQHLVLRLGAQIEQALRRGDWQAHLAPP